MARILLCYPNPSISSPQRNPALSIFYPGAALEQAGHQVFYWDERWDSEYNLLDKMSQATYVGVSSKTGYQLKGAIRVLQIAKLWGNITILGGIHPSLLPMQCAKHPCVDYVIEGEGEGAIVGLMDCLEKGSGFPFGVYTQKGGVPRPHLKLEEIPSPITEKTLPYFLKSLPDDVMLPSSRGCPFKCGFCYNSCYHKSKWRPISLEQWEADLDKLPGIRWLQMADDYIGPRERILDIAEALHKRGIKWLPQLRADQIDAELIRQIARLGCTGVAVGIESGSDRVLQEIVHKQETVRDYLLASQAIARCQLRPLYYFIVGFPGETQDDLKQTFSLADQLYRNHDGNLSIVFYSFTPLPGTPLFSKAQEMGIPIPQDMEGWSDYSLNQSYSKELANIYHIAGLHFHQGKGDKTDRNFPGLRRLLIAPFETLCSIRWKLRYWKYFDMERWCIEGLLKYANKR